MDGTITPTIPLNGNNYDGFGGGSGIWLFAILALMWGNWGGRGNMDGRCATVEDLNNSANFTRLENQVMNNGQSLQQYYMNIANGMAQQGYQDAMNFGALEKQIMENTCQINSNITAQAQSIKDMLCQNKIESLQEQVRQLQLNQSLNGVVRYPQGMTYAAPNPYFGCGCNNSNI